MKILNLPWAKASAKLVDLHIAWSIVVHSPVVFCKLEHVRDAKLSKSFDYWLADAAKKLMK